MHVAQGCDKEGRGLIIVKVANHHSKGRDLRQMKMFSVYIMEAMVRGASLFQFICCFLC